MADEPYHAPLAAPRIVRPEQVISKFSGRGRRVQAIEHYTDMLWMVFDELRSRLVIPTTADEKK